MVQVFVSIVKSILVHTNFILRSNENKCQVSEPELSKGTIVRIYSNKTPIEVYPKPEYMPVITVILLILNHSDYLNQSIFVKDSSSTVGTVKSALCDHLMAWVSPGLEIGKTWKNGKAFFQSGNFVKTGKVREFYSKYWKNQKKLCWKIEKNTGKVWEICQLVIVKTLQIWDHTLKKRRTLKNTGKLQKILEKSGKFVSPKKWEPCYD